MNVTKQTTILLSIAVILTEAHSVLYYFSPAIAETKLDLFWCAYPIFEIEVQHYVHGLCNDLFKLIVLFAFCNAVRRQDDRLLFVVSVFLMYQIIDIFLFMYNYKRTAGVYWLLTAAIIISVIFISRNQFYKLKKV